MLSGCLVFESGDECSSGLRNNLQQVALDSGHTVKAFSVFFHPACCK